LGSLINHENVKFFEYNQGFVFFQVGQLFDDTNNVPWVGLELLDEACDDKMNLEAVVCAMGENEA
jgi:hypothetical protein